MEDKKAMMKSTPMPEYVRKLYQKSNPNMERIPIAETPEERVWRDLVFEIACVFRIFKLIEKIPFLEVKAPYRHRLDEKNYKFNKKT